MPKDRAVPAEARAEALGDRIGEPTVSVVRFMPDQTRLYQKASFIGTILQDVGLPRSSSQDVDEFALEIGPEQVELADADVVFFTAYGPEADTTQSQVTSTPLWSNLGAVRGGRIYAVPDDYWMLGIGIQAANLVLDDLERLLADGALPRGRSGSSSAGRTGPAGRGNPSGDPKPRPAPRGRSRGDEGAQA
ncbi:MAG TPA: ABC transporter substrate-binding protein [Egibacteraceae bacterium]|nr:ABC transporter substrate-binding protein [Egibacteraceae bacterium]